METIQIFGFIQRGHIMAKFGVSMPLASTDLQTFQKAHPGYIKYDASAKRYVAQAVTVERD